MVDINCIYVNKKNKTEYIVHAIGIDCTNAREGNLMIRYSAIGGNSDNEYYREIEEFDEKFTKKKFK